MIYYTGWWWWTRELRYLLSSCEQDQKTFNFLTHTHTTNDFTLFTVSCCNNTRPRGTFARAFCNFSTTQSRPRLMVFLSQCFGFQKVFLFILFLLPSPAAGENNYFFFFTNSVSPINFYPSSDVINLFLPKKRRQWWLERDKDAADYFGGGNSSVFFVKVKMTQLEFFQKWKCWHTHTRSYLGRKIDVDTDGDYFLTRFSISLVYFRTIFLFDWVTALKNK